MPQKVRLMFLAWCEIKQNRVKFLVLTLGISLISYMLFTLNGMASAMMAGMVGALKNIDADYVLLQEGVNRNIANSLLSERMLRQVRKSSLVEKATPVTMTFAGFKKGRTSFDGVVFGFEPASLSQPKVTQGKAATDLKRNEIILDDSAISRYGVVIGSKLRVKPYGRSLKVAGFTHGRMYSMTTTGYLNMRGWKYLMSSHTATLKPNAIFIRTKGRPTIASLRDDLQTEEREVEILSLEQAYLAMQGVQEQNMVLSAMKGISFMVGVIIIGFFFYILALQKIPHLALVKALGGSTGYLFRTLLWQALLVTSGAMMLGLAGAWLTKYAMPPIMPYKLTSYDIITGVLMSLLFGLSGSLFSLRRLASIDPLLALGMVE